MYGNHSHIVGLDRCEAYRESISPERRIMGPAGMFNSATNLLNKLLKLNPEWQKYENDNKPAYSTPHAKQYLHQYYCPVCTKVHKIENK